MPKGYRQLCREERDRIAVLKAEGQSLREIAAVLDRDVGTVSRELRRNGVLWNTGFEYMPHQAQERAEVRKAAGHERQRLPAPGLKMFVIRMLRDGWSPERIAGRWTMRGNEPVSHEAIYQWIYAERRDLVPFLLRAHRRRHRPYNYRRGKRCIQIPSRIPISQRPESVGLRQEPGHWEADTMISSKSKAALQVVVERKARYARLMPLPAKTAFSMHASLVDALGTLPRNLRRTITYDNGSENMQHQQTNQSLGTQSYFCEPMRSWEKGSVENVAGLVRRWLPKGTDFAKVSPDRLRNIESWLNNLPRKCLGFQTPTEALRASVALTS